MNPKSIDLWELSPRLRTLIQAELQDGETIAWVGQPIASRFAWRTLPIVLFGIPWTAFALFWTAGAAGFKIPEFKQGSDLFPLFGLPFILIGLGMLTAPYWMACKARRTAYVLTDRRAILLDGGFSTTIRSFGPERLRDLRRIQRSDASGDLVFERTHHHDSDGGRCTTDHGFLAIPDVKAIEDLVRQLAESEASREQRSSHGNG